MAGNNLTDLTLFRRYTRSLRLYELAKNETGKYAQTDHEPKVAWYLNHNFNKEDEPKFEAEVLRRLQGKNLTGNWTKMTEAQIDDVITCAASIFIRSNFTMNFKFTDLSKYENYIGFESGIICLYPSRSSQSFLERKDHGCKDNKWYIEKYLNNDTSQAIPDHYDPRCRAWYQKQYESDATTFTEIYRFSQNNRLGITNCVPIRSDELTRYFGAYCMDVYPTSENKRFMDRYYQHIEDGPIDYLIFTKDYNFEQANYMASEFKNYL